MANHPWEKHEFALFVRRASVWAGVLLLGLTPLWAGADLYVETVIDPSGQLRITTRHHKEIVPQKEPDQTAFGVARISPDGHAVGWLELFSNCCTSYPIPLKLVVLVNGEQRSFTGNGLPIWRWRFWGEGKQVAFEQETVHGGMGVHYELRDLSTGELAGKYDPDTNPEAVTKPPKWVVVLNAQG